MTGSSRRKLPDRYGHFLFAVIQAGITASVASAITSTRLSMDDLSMTSWFSSWLISWATMVPIVLLAAPAIKRLVLTLTSGER